jgi:subtilase family serine protease
MGIRKAFGVGAACTVLCGLAAALPIAAGGRAAAASPPIGIGTPRMTVSALRDFGATSTARGLGAASAPSASASAPPTSAECVARYGIPCYSPLQVERAYDLPPLYKKGLAGQGRTIVIVDPYGSPTIRNDLTTFDDAFGLPAPPSFKILQPLGPVPPFDPGNPGMVGAAGETTGDVELAHEIAPGANIVLVQFPLTATTEEEAFSEAMTAEDDVIRQGIGDVFSQSFGLPEQDFVSPAAIGPLRFAYRDAYARRVTMLAASGDSGASGPTLTGGSFDQRIVYWPASDPLVTGVGGTQLHLAASGERTAPDSAWNDNQDPVVQKAAGSEYLWAGGGGRSDVFGRPGYQDSVGRTTGDARGVPDISMSASFSGAVLAYESFTGAPGLWLPGGGTSAASPLLAGIVAIADQDAHARLGLINPALYKLELQHAPGIVDVTRGNNTVSFTVGGTPVTVPGFPAKPGYDLVTGVGTVDAARFVPELAAAARLPSR